MAEVPETIRGWWRIVETRQWVNDGLDILGPALISFTGYADRLRMHCLLAYVNVRPTKTGVSFTWEGAWEYDQMSGTGSARVGKDGRLKGTIRIKDGGQQHVHGGEGRGAGRADPVSALVPGQVAAAVVTGWPRNRGRPRTSVNVVRRRRDQGRLAKMLCRRPTDRCLPCLSPVRGSGARLLDAQPSESRLMLEYPAPVCDGSEEAS